MFQLDDIEDEDMSQFDIPNREPIWSHPSLDPISTYASPVCYDGTAYRLVVSTGNGFWGLIIPEAKDDNPLIIKLSSFASQPLTLHLGVCKTYTDIDRDGIDIRTGYSWDDEGGFPMMNYSSERQEGIPFFGLYARFDEVNGRLAYVLDQGIRVVDFR